MRYYFLGTSLVIFILVACGKEKALYENIEEPKIIKLMAELESEELIDSAAQKHKSGMYYYFDNVDSTCTSLGKKDCKFRPECGWIDCEDGCSRACRSISWIEWNYRLYNVDTLLEDLENNNILIRDASPIVSTFGGATNPIQSLDSLVVGLQLVFTDLRQMTVGSSGYFVLPSKLAFKDASREVLSDSSGLVTLPPNSPLLFYIDFVEVHPHF